MLGMISRFESIFQEYNLNYTAPNVIQTLSEQELKLLLPEHDGWIIGDDPATREVFEAGKKGKLKAAIKWGIGTDNIDFQACRDFDIQIDNTPNIFGAEVADIALGYIIGLARHTFEIDRAVREGFWPKPPGISLKDKTVAVIGYGDIGKSLAKRLAACDMKIIIYDPYLKDFKAGINEDIADWPERILEADFIVTTCSLNETSKHMLNKDIFSKVKSGVRIVNVGRGPIINQLDLEFALNQGVVYSAALDVFEDEPLPITSALHRHPRCIFGSHNASNTIDAVERASILSINKLIKFLNNSIS